MLIVPFVCGVSGGEHISGGGAIIFSHIGQLRKAMQGLRGLSFGLDFLESSCAGSGVSSLGEQVSVMQGPLVLYIRKNRPRPVNFFIPLPTNVWAYLFALFLYVSLESSLLIIGLCKA